MEGGKVKHFTLTMAKFTFKGALPPPPNVSMLSFLMDWMTILKKP